MDVALVTKFLVAHVTAENFLIALVTWLVFSISAKGKCVVIRTKKILMVLCALPCVRKLVVEWLNNDKVNSKVPDNGVCCPCKRKDE